MVPSLRPITLRSTAIVEAVRALAPQPDEVPPTLREGRPWWHPPDDEEKDEEPPTVRGR